jgi:hypothetical protein
MGWERCRIVISMIVNIVISMIVNIVICISVAHIIIDYIIIINITNTNLKPFFKINRLIISIITILSNSINHIIPWY